jgi:uncharacterized membrane protein
MAAGRRSLLILFVFVVLSNVAGNTLLSRGMKSPTAPLNMWVVAGVALLIAWTLSRLVLLSRADLTWVLPVTSIGYVLAAFTGWLFLGEHVGWQRWIGGSLVAAGAGLAGVTAPNTTAPTHDTHTLSRAPLPNRSLAPLPSRDQRER